MANSLLLSMQISASGMSAQRSRMDIVAENIANAESTRTDKGGPYRRRLVVFEAQGETGSFQQMFSSSLLKNQQAATMVKVNKIQEDPRPFKEVYDPTHPDADKNGMVKYPNVNSVEEMVDMTSAARAYESNVTVMQSSKRMFLKTLELLK